MFRDRPGADVVLDDSHRLQLVPSIHNNPVEAGIVTDPGEYEGHTDSLCRNGTWEKGPLDAWQYPPCFEGEDRNRIYQERMGEDVEETEGGDGYIGNEEEWSKLQRRYENRGDRFRERRGRRSLDDIVGETASQHEVNVDRLKEPGRARREARIRHEAMVEMYEEGQGPKEIGNFFNRNKGSWSMPFGKKIIERLYLRGQCRQYMRMTIQQYERQYLLIN